MLAAALFTGAAVLHAKPKDVYDRLPDAEVPNSLLFQQGVNAYDRGDPATAFEIWLPLAQHNDLAAARNVALLLRKGEGVPRDPERALWFYEDAGQKGFLPAQLNAAFMHLEGDGIPVDKAAAAYWFRAASAHPVAAYNLAVLYERGEGVPRDIKAATLWYEKAARLGSEQARQRLAELATAAASPLPPPALLTLPEPGEGDGKQPSRFETPADQASHDGN